MNNRKLVLETGEVFEGIGFGSSNEAIAELVFNTAVVGYQENLSDPSNCNQLVCMAYPVIGNYGLTDEDYESSTLTVSGIIAKTFCEKPSNFRYTHKLTELMEENGVPGLADVDTREIVRILKNKGTMRAIICDINKPIADCMKAIKEYESPKNITALISTKKVVFSRTANPEYTVACIDCGVKRSLVKMLNEVGCNVVVLPYNTSVEEIMKHKPNGIFISDGPGNPNNVVEVADLIKQLKGKLPMLGVGLGNELIALSYGAKLIKLKVGHNGCNLPVRNLKTNKIEITSQNDLYAIDPKSIEKTGLTVTHKNLLDDVIEGIENEADSVVAVQYNPSVDMTDPQNVFARFINNIKNFGGKR